MLVMVDDDIPTLGTTAPTDGRSTGTTVPGFLGGRVI